MVAWKEASWLLGLEELLFGNSLRKALEFTLQIVGAFTEVARLHVALLDRRDVSGSRGLLHVQLQQLAVTMRVVYASPVDAGAWEDGVDHANRDITRVDAMWMSAAAEVH